MSERSEVRFSCLHDLCHDGCARMAGRPFNKNYHFLVLRGDGTGHCPALPLCVVSSRSILSLSLSRLSFCLFYLLCTHTTFNSSNSITPYLFCLEWVVCCLILYTQPIQGHSNERTLGIKQY